MTARPPYATRRLSAAEFASGVVAVGHPAFAAYRWDAGMAIGGFLDGLRQGRILGRACRVCGRVLLPPRAFCEQCFRPTDAWVELPPTGTLVAFSVCQVAWDMAPLPVPEIAAVIAVDGAQGPSRVPPEVPSRVPSGVPSQVPPGVPSRVPPGRGALLHRVGEVAPDAVSVGMALRAVWRPPAERTGSVLDLDHWAPRDAAG